MVGENGFVDSSTEMLQELREFLILRIGRSAERNPALENELLQTERLIEDIRQCREQSQAPALPPLVPGPPRNEKRPFLTALHFLHYGSS
jgi:hypothetical protein